MDLITKVSQIPTAPPAEISNLKNVSKIWTLLRDIWEKSYSLVRVGPINRTAVSLQEKLVSLREESRQLVEEFFERVSEKLSSEDLLESVDSFVGKCRELGLGEIADYMSSFADKLRDRLQELEERLSKIDVDTAIKELQAASAPYESVFEKLLGTGRPDLFFGLDEVSSTLSRFISENERREKLKDAVNLAKKVYNECAAFNTQVNRVVIQELLSVASALKSVVEQERELQRALSLAKEKEVLLTKDEIDTLANIERIASDLLRRLQYAFAEASRVSNLVSRDDFQAIWDEHRKAVESALREFAQGVGYSDEDVEGWMQEYFSGPTTFVWYLADFKSVENMLEWIRKFGPNFMIEFVQRKGDIEKTPDIAVSEYLDELKRAVQELSEDELKKEFPELAPEGARTLLSEVIDRVRSGLESGSVEPDRLAEKVPELTQKDILEAVKQVADLTGVPIKERTFLFSRGDLKGDEVKLLTDIMNSETGQARLKSLRDLYRGLIVQTLGEEYAESADELVSGAIEHVIVDLIRRVTKTSSLIGLPKFAEELTDESLFDLLVEVAKKANIDVSEYLKSENKAEAYRALLNDRGFWDYISKGVHNVLSSLREKAARISAAAPTEEEITEELAAPLTDMVMFASVKVELDRLTPLELLTLALQGLSARMSNKTIAQVLCEFFGEERLRDWLEKKLRISLEGKSVADVVESLLDSVKKSRDIKLSRSASLALETHAFSEELEPVYRDLYFWKALLSQVPELGRDKEIFYKEIVSYRAALDTKFWHFYGVEDESEKGEPALLGFFRRRASDFLRELKDFSKRLEIAISEEHSSALQKLRGLCDEIETELSELLAFSEGLETTPESVEEVRKEFRERQRRVIEYVSSFTVRELEYVQERVNAILTSLEELGRNLEKSDPTSKAAPLDVMKKSYRLSTTASLSLAASLDVDLSVVKECLDRLLEICSGYVADDETKEKLVNILRRTSDALIDVARALDEKVRELLSKGNARDATAALGAKDKLGERATQFSSLAAAAEVTPLIETYKERAEIFRAV